MTALADPIRGCTVIWDIRSNADADQGGTSSMKRLALALLVLPLAQSGASAQTPAGSAAAGKADWERGAPRATTCRHCHGGAGGGAFWAGLSGRRLKHAQLTPSPRTHWGIMSDLSVCTIYGH